MSGFSAGLLGCQIQCFDSWEIATKLGTVVHTHLLD